jgi:glycosyltransferase involved in cell wall biosynthesis
VVRILVDYRPALRERTGVGEYVHEAARALIATQPAGETLVLFSASWKDRLPPDVVPGAVTVDRRIPVRLLNYGWHRLEWPPVELLTTPAPDVVQSAHPLLLPSRRAAQLVMVHDLDFLDHPDRTRGEIRRDYATLTPAHVRRADHVVTVSEHTALEVETRLGVPRTRLSICPPGAPGWTRREAEPVENGCLLFLGTLEPRKNVGVLLDAYERLLARRPGCPPLVLAGRVTPDAEPIAQRVRGPAFAGRVELPGYVHPEARLALYRRAIVFVLPSHTEGFGMPAVVAADRGALRQSVGAAGRLVDPSDPEALANALDDILADRALRQRMSDAGRRHAEAFTWTRTATGLRDAWARALDRRRMRHD